jgi:hypothetical protein
MSTLLSTIDKAEDLDDRVGSAIVIIVDGVVVVVKPSTG